MGNSKLHPSAVLFAWLAVLVGIQALALVPLAALLVVSLIAAPVGMRRRWRHLARRSRWLIVVLGLTFLFSTPGEALQAGFPGTLEGVLAALEHVARFLMIIAAVAWLLDGLTIAELMAGLYRLLAPAARCGLAVDRAVARLALVLEYVEAERLPVWRALVAAASETPAATQVEIELRPVRPIDRSVVALGGVLLILAVSA